MKKILLTLLLALPLFGMAQITEVKDESIKIGHLKDIECNKTDAYYFFTYKDYTYDYISEFQTFAVSTADLETLYNKLNEAFDLPGKEQMTLNLPGYTLRIANIKMLGVTGIFIYNTDKRTGITSLTQTINKKQLSKLFGKV